MDLFNFNASDIAQWLTIAIAIGYFWIALRNQGSERHSKYGIGDKSMAEANAIQGDRILELTKEVKDLKTEFAGRLNVLERKKFRITMDFEIGDPPKMGVVLIEPIIDTEKTRPSMKKPNLK